MKNEKGQTLLIVVLVMVVVLTIGLSVASRSITNLRTTTEEENSQRAFSAAEAGVEEAIKSSQTGEIISNRSLGNNANILQVKSVSVGGSEFVLNGGNPISKDDGADIWLSDYPNYTNPKKTTGSELQFFTIYWGFSQDACPPEGNAAAIEVIVLYGTTKASASTKRFAFDPCSRPSNNNFSSLSPNDSGNFSVAEKTFHYKTPYILRSPNIPNNNELYIVRVVPLYGSTPIGVTTCNPGGQNCTPLPAQGKQIESTGSSLETVRKITYFQGHPKLPAELFQYIIFSSQP
ncbi:MAG: hypothetical protein HYV39_00185 [Candidatus Levybacteria bacterium]|nr:hypothetical protein [Candidatus Levybacteria bacterium]